jgi:hypothetical protein
MREHIYYTVTIDNGADYSAELHQQFDTYEAAEDFGNDWLKQFFFDNNIAPEDQDFDEAGFDVNEVECEGCETCCTDECPGCAQCYEDDSPTVMGWVGKDGRP